MIPVKELLNFTTVMLLVDLYPEISLFLEIAAALQADYDGLKQFMQRAEHYCSGDQNYLWDETFEQMLILWKEYIQANG